jgi:catechol 2,3-dioxygenase-like lactoylglutathione lyase family enzyme
MKIIGLEELVFGVDDVPACEGFLADYGLSAAGDGRFEAVDGSAVVLKASDDASLPKAFGGKSPSIREVVFAVAEKGELEKIAKEIGKDREVVRDADGSVAFHDDEGFPIKVQLTKRRSGASLNPPPKVNQPGVSYDMQALPQSLSHVVFFVRDSARAEAFYRDRLGFVTTDRFTGVGPFMRTGAQRDHHAVFFIQTPPFMTGVEHFTFHMSSGAHAIMAGTRFEAKGYKSFWGPGRHIFGSNWFWYFKSPMGCNIEYDAEMDQHDDDWVPREDALGPDTAQIFLFAEAEKWMPGPGKH